MLAKAIERGDWSREAPDDRVEPPPRRLDREGLPRSRRPVPRPDPGGHARPEPRGREVRLAPRLQVLDVRDLVDPPVGAARRSRITRARSAFRCTSSSASRSCRARRAGSRSSSAARRRRKSSPRRPVCRCSTSTRRSAAASASVSLNQTVGADDEGELGDLFADREAADPFDEAEESLRRQDVRKALDALPERERRILELRFGFEGEPWTLEAIGHELDLTRERVRQLEGQALSRLAALRELAGLAA